MGRTTGQSRRHSQIQYTQYILHGRETTTLVFKWRLHRGVQTYGITDSIRMTKDWYVSEFTLFLRSRKFVSGAGREKLETISPLRSVHRVLYSGDYNVLTARWVFASQASTQPGGSYRAKTLCRSRRAHPLNTCTQNPHRRDTY